MIEEIEVVVVRFRAELRAAGLHAHRPGVRLAPGALPAGEPL